MSALLDQCVLVAVSDPATADLLSEAVRADGSRLVVVADGDTALAQARVERPALVLVERDLPGRDAFALASALRAQHVTGEPAPTVVMIASTEHADDSRRAAAAGVDDVLAQPFSPMYARARIRAWRQRTACRWQRAATPHNENDRLDALRRLRVLDTEPEERFERITRLAAEMFEVPIALISSDRQRSAVVQVRARPARYGDVAGDRALRPRDPGRRRHGRQ